MKVLDSKQISQKVDRLAYQILENNYNAKTIIFLGINKNGLKFAKMLQQTFDKISENESLLGSVKINAKNPIESEIEMDVDVKSLNKKVVIIVDDVANTGRTIFYGTKPIMEFLPQKIEAAVLVDRKHKQFPILVDYVGLSLATTLKENIKVDLSKKATSAVYLE